jgi:hypothetical protein
MTTLLRAFGLAALLCLVDAGRQLSSASKSSLSGSSVRSAEQREFNYFMFVRSVLQGLSCFAPLDNII